MGKQLTPTASRITPVSILEARRRERGFSQAALAKQVGISRGYVTVIERGYRPPDPMQKSIAQALDCSPSTLWPEEPE